MTCRVPVYVIGILFFASGCTAPKQNSSQKNSSTSSHKVVNKNPKFLDDISISQESSSKKTGNQQNSRNDKKYTGIPRSSEVDGSTPLRVKYALLLNAEVEDIQNEKLFRFIDDWYGTRYCMGGTTKTCIDCSGFVQTFFSAVYGASIPRTSKEQYSFTNRISSKKMKQGDLLFFNTRGGVSHVGIYLMNNKFVHASTSNGVMISDLSETYYAKRFISAGRVDMQIEMPGR